MNKLKVTEAKIHQLAKDSSGLRFPEFLKELRKAYGLGRRQVCKDLAFSEMRMFWLESGCFKRDIPTTDLVMLAEYYGIAIETLIAKYQLFKDLSQNQSQIDYQPKKKRGKRGK